MRTFLSKNKVLKLHNEEIISLTKKEKEIMESSKLEKLIKKETEMEIKLNDGALFGLSDGAKMKTESAIIEYVDNAEDAGASFVDVIIDNERNILTILSKEETNLEKEDWEKLYNLGVSGKVHTKNGVGKYSLGFKYAGSQLIGQGNKGKVITSVRPISGNNWAIEQNIDYTKDDKGTDKKLQYIDFDELDMPEGFNFMIKIVGCKNITDREINLLKVYLGLRYREKIQNGETTIRVNGGKVKPQDRLYSHFGSRVDYHKPQYFDWNGHKNAISFEWSDLRANFTNKNDDFDRKELIDYDSSLGISGRPNSVKVTERCGVEIAINGVTINYQGNLKELINVEVQPDSIGFRGRLNFLNKELADKYIKGANKSDSVVDKSFSENEDVEEVRETIRTAHQTTRSRHDNKCIKNVYDIKEIDNWCKKHKIKCKFYFNDSPSRTSAFEPDSKNKIININTSSNLFCQFKGTANKSKLKLFVISLIQGCNNENNFSSIYDKLEDFRRECEKQEVIKL